MLHSMRKGVKSLPAKVLIGLLVASFAVWGIGDIFSFRLDSRVAQVGDTEVAATRFIDALRREQSRISRQAGQLVSYDMMRAAGLDQRVLSGLIRDAAFTEELDGLGIAAPDEAVADAIRSNPTFQGPGGEFAPQAYSILLAQQGFSAAEFEALTRTLLTQQILTETAEAAILPPPGAGARIAAFQGENRVVTAVTLTLDSAPDPGMPDEGALRAYYEANEPMFTEPERRWGEYLHIDAAKLRADLVPDEATLRAEYEANLDAYTVEESRVIDQIAIPTREAVDAAMARLLAGEATFETLGAEFGLEAEDLSLGKVTRSDLPDAAAGLVFDEEKPGIIGPVQLPAGFAIFRIREISLGGAAPFEAVSAAIGGRLANDLLLVRAPEFANQIDELRAEGLSMPEIFQRIGVDAGVAYGTFDGLARDATLADGTTAASVEASPAFVSEVFTALDAEERDLVETPDGGYLLVQVARIEPSAVQTLDQVRDRAVAAWQTAEKLKAIESKGAELVARLGQDASIWDISAELGLTAKPHGPFSRMSPPPALPGALVEAIFKAGPAGGASAVSDDGTQVIVAQVSSITPLGPEAIATNSAAIDQALADSLRSDMTEYFARAVVARHDARIESGVIDEVFRRLGANGGLDQ
ncbi:MAG TPA: SurA N-terminal domain-containing protein [Thermohalobaculum sp.]|nr:SurA N-terminal domain-containing protein [Thermohalobaculum sp.]